MCRNRRRRDFSTCNFSNAAKLVLPSWLLYLPLRQTWQLALDHVAFCSHRQQGFSSCFLIVICSFSQASFHKFQTSASSLLAAMVLHNFYTIGLLEKLHEHQIASANCLRDICKIILTLTSFIVLRVEGDGSFSIWLWGVFLSGCRPNNPFVSGRALSTSSGSSLFWCYWPHSLGGPSLRTHGSPAFCPAGRASCMTSLTQTLKLEI